MEEDSDNNEKENGQTNTHALESNGQLGETMRGNSYDDEYDNYCPWE